MTASTEHRIFHVPELLEAILLKFPTRHLLLSKRVCKTWKNCIESSVELNKALFLKPDGEVWSDLKAIQATKSGRALLRLNPLLGRHLFRFNEGNYDVDLRGKVIIHDSLLGSDKIWKKMLLSQPPISEFSTAFYWDNEETADEETADEDREYVKVKNSNGLTMGDITRALQEELRRMRGRGSDYGLSTFDVEDLTEDCYAYFDDLDESST